METTLTRTTKKIDRTQIVGEKTSFRVRYSRPNGDVFSSEDWSFFVEIRSATKPFVLIETLQMNPTTIAGITGEVFTANYTFSFEYLDINLYYRIGRLHKASGNISFDIGGLIDFVL